MLPTSTEGQATLKASGKKSTEEQVRLKLREIENIEKSIAAETAARQAADQKLENIEKSITAERAAREAADRRTEEARKAQEAADRRTEEARKAQEAADKRTAIAEQEARAAKAELEALKQQIALLQRQAQEDFPQKNTAVLLSGGPSGGINTANSVNTNNGATTSGIKEIRSPTVKAF